MPYQNHLRAGNRQEGEMISSPSQESEFLQVLHLPHEILSSLLEAFALQDLKLLEMSTLPPSAWKSASIFLSSVESLRSNRRYQKVCIWDRGQYTRVSTCIRQAGMFSEQAEPLS